MNRLQHIIEKLEREIYHARYCGFDVVFSLSVTDAIYLVPLLKALREEGYDDKQEAYSQRSGDSSFEP